MLGMTKAALSSWNSGRRAPSFESALRAADLFQVAADRLAQAPFESLLARELADPERFRAVEQEIHKRRVAIFGEAHVARVAALRSLASNVVPLADDGKKTPTRPRLRTTKRPKGKGSE